MEYVIEQYAHSPIRDPHPPSFATYQKGLQQTVEHKIKFLRRRTTNRYHSLRPSCEIFPNKNSSPSIRTHTDYEGIFAHDTYLNATARFATLESVSRSLQFATCSMLLKIVKLKLGMERTLHGYQYVCDLLEGNTKNASTA